MTHDTSQRLFEIKQTLIPRLTLSLSPLQITIVVTFSENRILVDLVAVVIGAT